MPIVEEWLPDRSDWLQGSIWFGYMSQCHRNGEMFQWLYNYLQSLPNEVRLFVPRCDGLKHNSEEHLESIQSIYAKPQERLITMILSSRGVYHPSLLYMPLDDTSFRMGVKEHLYSLTTPVPWENKLPEVFWRGKPTSRLRYHLVDMFGHHNIQMTYTKEDNVSLQTYLNYKYLLIVDGTCIASSFQWTFASGSVPILVTHPDNEFWFRRYICPMKHYVPVSYDLSDLDEKIAWLISHDDEARQIAQNAMEFAEYYLSSGFQKYHLEEEIKRLNRTFHGGGCGGDGDHPPRS
jgi:Glycosyl transferase family 90